MMKKKEVKMTLEVSRELCPNPDIVYLHARVEISATNWESFQRPLRVSSEEFLGRLGEGGAELVRRVMAVPGVTEISITPYALRMEKARLFTWDEILPQVEKAFQEVFAGRKREEVRYLSLPEVPAKVILAELLDRTKLLSAKAKLLSDTVFAAVKQMLAAAKLLLVKGWYKIPDLNEP